VNFEPAFSSRTLIGLFAGSFILVLGGLLDDYYTLRPRYQVLPPLLACMAMIFSGYWS
jgi:UDP-N-acetylmuramyl pentapeptide phosphotransferase/UDP-N-acetylglucosamine-1-phosphate transferase